MTEESPSPIATPDDLSYELALSAHRWSSHVPEERARRDRQAYADAVNGLHARMLELARTDGQKATLAAEIERYRLGYLEHYGALLRAESRTASSTVTGPSNFPVERNRKRMQTADRRRGEFLEWEKRARAAVERKILDARPEEVKQDDRWAELRRDLEGSLAMIRAIDEEGSPYTRGSFVNSIAGKVERLALAGETPLVEQALALVRAYNAEHEKSAISPRHGFWQLGELAARKATEHDAALSMEPEVVASGEGVEIVANAQLDRVQIVFAAKPDSVTLGALKREGWNWSRAEGAWQRKLTEAAKASARSIVGLS